MRRLAPFSLLILGFAASAPVASARVASARVASTLAAEDVLVVDAAGGGDYLDLQAALDAAQQRDTILVKSGSYGGFLLTNKSLNLVAEAGTTPHVTGLATIADLPKGRDVSVSGLDFQAGLEVRDCLASVLFVECVLFVPSLGNASHAQRVLACEDATFARCSLTGQKGDSDLFCGDIYDGLDGGHALLVVDSTVTMYTCSVIGGEGGFSQDGSCLFCFCAYKGDGGDGLHIEGASYVYLDGTVPLGGPKGVHWASCSPSNCETSKDGEAIYQDATATLELATHEPLGLTAPTVLRENEFYPVTLTGPAGAKAYLLWALDPGWRAFGPDLGILHLKSAGLNFVSLGAVPANGVIQADLTLPTLPPGDEALRLYVQPFALFGGRLLGNAWRVVVIDPSL